MIEFREPEENVFDSDEDIDLDAYYIEMHRIEFHEDLIEFLSLNYQYRNGNDCMLFEGIRCEYWIERSMNNKSIIELKPEIRQNETYHLLIRSKLWQQNVFW
jgi:hypothetical protein